MPKNSSKTAIFLWRFQPFHIGHMSIVDQIFSDGYERLLIIIGSAEKSGTDENPWTLQEREEIIRASIPIELQEKLDIVWLPDVPDDDIWCENLKNLLLPPWQGGIKGGFLQWEITLFTGNQWVRDICERHEIKTDWIVPTIDISGTKIREMIRRGEDITGHTNLGIKQV